MHRILSFNFSSFISAFAAIKCFGDLNFLSFTARQETNDAICYPVKYSLSLNINLSSDFRFPIFSAALYQS